MQHFIPKSAAAIAISSLLLVSGGIAWVQSVAAQSSGSGFLIQGVPNREEILRYSLDFGGLVRRLDRYRLNIPAQDVAVAEVQANFDARFDGTVNPEQVRLEVEGEPVDIDEVFWSEEFKSLEVVLEEPVAAGQRMKLVLSRTRNPDRPGFYRIQARVLGTEANPLFRYVGVWVLSIERRSSRGA
ncbi:DUF2808 domain-containing protein [Synechococcus sp. PCC 7336]|uniref:DUF2808 domain-containing protein n=1 Tax=Synechococcus sp. PCC 7336 TaxID=195250 RepID=UPI000348F353|nr:DUF2808 domain-containing protein [Synechococcus sp. PCC 7336]